MRLTRSHHRWSKSVILTFIFLLFHYVFYLPAFSQDAEFDRITELIEKSNQLYKEGKYKEAISYVIEVCAQTENALGPEHPDVAAFRAKVAGLKDMDLYSAPEVQKMLLEMLAATK